MGTGKKTKFNILWVRNIKINKSELHFSAKTFFL